MTNTKAPSLAADAVKAPAAVQEKPKESTFISMKDSWEINWFHTILLTGIPTIALYGLFTTTLQLPTMILAVIMYAWTGMGITGGYHRLWSHRAYRATWIVRFILCLGGAAAFEGSAKWWCRNHRAHHRYTDTSKDPYNAKRGFFYSHLGWMLMKQNGKNIGYADISDLQRDPMIQWQHKYYLPIAVSVGFVFPMLVASLWGDVRGAFFFACMGRVFFVHHATFFVNSLAHSFGDKTFSDLHTAFDSVVTAVLTLGEGYHNYHHEFPHDYRNGIRFYHYDPTKWLIGGLSFFGLTYDLKQISDEEIEKARIQMKQRMIDVERTHLNEKFNGLPKMSWVDFQSRVSRGEKLVIIDGVVHDVASFAHEHPGGRQTLLNVVGTDATEMFEGREDNVHVHSKEARKYLRGMRIAQME